MKRVLLLSFGLLLAACGSRSHSSAPSVAASTAAPVASASAPVATPGVSVVPPAGAVPFQPSDDPDDWTVDTTATWDPVVSAPMFVAPSSSLPAGVLANASNNNCAITLHDGRLFLAFRTSDTHFASMNTRMYVVSSTDLGKTWELEHEVALGCDVREPSLTSIGGQLVFLCFEAGTNPLAFEPKGLRAFVRQAQAKWAPATLKGLASGEVPWDIKVRRGRAFMTSYLGNHYAAGAGTVEAFFKTSPNGLEWTPVDPSIPHIYAGGLSEIGWELDERGDLWAVGRNEDGDATGFGSMVATASAGALGKWTWPSKSDPERYDSPEMFRHGNDLYLVARRDVGGPFDLGLPLLPFDVKKWTYLGAYSARPKRTALYKIDRATRKVVHLVDLPGTGDTAFPSVHRLGADSFLLANYTSPLPDPNLSWIGGQTARAGTQVYLLTISFKKR